jgi:hypothetical protein
MADISITAANVAISANTDTQAKQAVAGATITAGQPIYLDPTSTPAGLATPAKTLTAVTSAVVGISLNGASSGQPVDYVVQDQAFVPGGTLVAGKVVMLSASTAGGFITQTPTDWDVTGQFGCILGIATSTTTMKFRANAIQRSGVAHG